MICELCDRDVEIRTKHHLIPKQKKTDGKYAWFCIPCSKQVHALFTNKELKKYYNTVSKLKAHPKVQKWIEWVRKKNPGDIRYHGKGGFNK